MESIPRLETERLKLRAVFPNDAQAIFELFADPKVAQSYEFEPFTERQQSVDLITQFTNWFQSDTSIRWAITLPTSGQLIGTCCFDTFQTKYQSVNMGYNIRSDHWGQGFATEAIRAIVGLAFDKGIAGAVNRIQAITLPENRGSERVLKKIGFRHEGLMRQYRFWKGQFRDMNRFGLIQSDW